MNRSPELSKLSPYFARPLSGRRTPARKKSLPPTRCFSSRPTADCPLPIAVLIHTPDAPRYSPPIALAGAWSGPGTREGRRCPGRSRYGGAARSGDGSGPGHVVDQITGRGPGRSPAHEPRQEHRRMRRRRARVLSQGSFLRAGRGTSHPLPDPFWAGGHWRMQIRGQFTQFGWYSPTVASHPRSELSKLSPYFPTVPSMSAPRPSPFHAVPAAVTLSP